MSASILYTNAKSSTDLEGILSLQARNHYSNITQDVADKEGFVSCIHDLELIKKMNSPYPHIVAKKGDEIVAYALVMTRAHSDALAILRPMFDKINSLDFEGHALKDSSYVVMGQICIDKEYRSRGIFRKLYENMKQQLAAKFDYIITEVDDDNKRSLAAHARCGFQTIEKYRSGKLWHLILLKTN